MFKSKHSGWTWDLKRTPFGPGGSPISGITDTISSALGTDGSGGGALGALASIDPGPAIGEGLASADKFMTNLTPYGWALPAALVAAYFTGGGSLAAEGAAEGAAAAGEAAATSAATEAGTAAYGEAIAAGASETEATAAANAAAESTLASSTGASTGTSGFGLNAGAPTVGASSPSGIAATQSFAGLGGTNTGIIEGLAPTSVGMGGTTGAGSLAGISGTEAAAGLGGANLGTGLTADQLAQYESTLTSSSVSANDVKNAAKLAQALTSSAGSQLNGAAQNLVTGQTGVGQAIPALLRGNQNPFLQTAQQPIRSTSPDLASLAQLLKQG